MSITTDKIMFPTIMPKAELLALYSPKGIGKQKMEKIINELLIASKQDRHAKFNKIIQCKELKFIIMDLGLPEGYTLDQFSFLTEKDL